MKQFIFLVAAISCASLALAAIDVVKAQALFDTVKDTDLVKSDPALVERVREKVRVKGCGVNLCFALDGSGSLGSDFQTQKDFVKLIAAIVGADDNSLFAGTVYGLVNENISKLTRNASKFLLDVCDAPFPSAPTTFISAGIGFCFNQLNDKRTKKDVNKIVLMGDGFSNFGDIDGPLAPVAIAQQWRNESPNNSLCAVAVGFPSIAALTRITGERALVLEVNEWPILLNILDSLVSNICFKVKPPPTTTPPTTRPPPKCPCKCFGGKRAFARAQRQCSKRKFSKVGCKVFNCGSFGKQCCH